MRQFIPFEDDWDLLKTLSPHDLIPYRVGLLGAQNAPDRSATLAANTPVAGMEAGKCIESFYPGSREARHVQRKM
jgi:alpha-D-ribose 1-methylphosphonate 5-triphosphate synthase subunit PhnH